MDFNESYWKKRKIFYPGYYFIYPQLNQSIKWRFDYVFIVKNKPKNGSYHYHFLVVRKDY